MASKKSSAKYKASVKRAAKVTGLTQAQVEAVDKEAAKANKRPLSFLASMLVKAEKAVPELRKDVARLAAKAK